MLAALFFFALPIAIFASLGWLVFRNPIAGSALGACILGLYCLLSLQGAYVLANHGGQHWTLSWCPPALVAPSARGDAMRPRTTPTGLGIALAPLLVADRLLWHKDRDPWPALQALTQSGV